MTAYKVFRQYGGGFQTIFGRAGDPLYYMKHSYSTDRSPAYHAYVDRNDAFAMSPVLGGVVIKVSITDIQSASLEDGRVVITGKHMYLADFPKADEQ